MKKIILLLVTSILISNGQILLGGKAGLNIANVVANESANADSKIGFNAGVVGSIGIGNSGKLFGVGEFAFMQKGGKNVVSGVNSLGYLELATLLRYQIGFGETVPLKLFLNAGPYFGIKTGRSAETSTVAGNVAEFGIGAGGGLSYPIGNGFLFLEGRYVFAVTNLVTETLERNAYTSISIGYLHTIKAKTVEAAPANGVQGGFE